MPSRPRPYRRSPLKTRLVAAIPQRALSFCRPLIDRRVRHLERRPTTALEARLLGQILIRQQRFDEADAVLSTALGTKPNDPELLTWHAFAAHNRGQYAEALQRWGRARDATPDDPMPWCGLAGNNRELLNLTEATETIRAALHRFPDDPSILNEAAMIADLRLDHAEALTFWLRMLETRRVLPEWRQGHIQSLMRLGRFEEAEQALDVGRGLHPKHPGLSATAAMLAIARSDLDEAERLLRDHLVRFPGDESGINLAADVKMMRALADFDARLGEIPPVRAEIDTIEDAPMRRLMLGCESIGTDCEFGLVQRRYGAEPLGMLRWNTAPTEGLLRGLAQRFDGVGEPSNSRLTCLIVSGEYYISDTRLGIYMHTFVPQGSVDEATFFAKMCVRLTFLKDKFLVDLAEAEKLFIYKARDGSREVLAELHRLLRSYGPVRLLAAREADEHNPPGSIRLIEEGLCLGFLRHFGDRGNAGWDIAFDDWIAVCAAAQAAMPKPSGASRLNVPLG